MRVTELLHAAGGTHPGLHREINEDRFYVDPGRGIFLVIDGVGGQAAGERAADTALKMVRARLERETGAIEDRIREAITIANNEIHRQAATRAEWKGMACVLTVAIVDNGHVVVGHVGDTRLYKLRRGHIEKQTRDHSPVGEREDAGELSEVDAMRHPRRNEVYRDVGSERHQLGDRDFIDVARIPFETDAALLLCSDGLTDCVTSSTINEIIERHAGEPETIVRALIDAANKGGGKDNVTAVYLEGARFVEGEDTRALRARKLTPPAPASIDTFQQVAPAERHDVAAEPAPSRWRGWLLVCLLFVLIAGAAYSLRDMWVLDAGPSSPALARRPLVVLPTGSITAALAIAQPGDEVLVEPGEYREAIVLKGDVRLRSRVPRAASIRPPGSATESDAAVTATDVTDTELRGFRIVGDVATPLGTGVMLRNANVTMIDIEVTGAQRAAIDFGGGPAAVIASYIHDNPGAGLNVRGGASPRLAHNVLQRNGTSPRAAGAIFVEPGARPVFIGNLFGGLRPQMLAVLTGGDVSELQRDNWFIEPPVTAPPASAPRPGRRGGR
jgi:serine/threonine protein phosphatase PrpC